MTSREFFNRLRKRTPRNAAAVDREIEKRTHREIVVLVSDSSGFTRRTQEHGILQFLAVMTQSYDKLIPILEKRRGHVLSHKADNILAVFDDPADAVRGAIDMQLRQRAYNRARPEPERFHICIGIHSGVAIRLKDDVYGDCVNITAKIGEDLAGKEDILVTREVAEKIKGRFKCAYERSTHIGGKMIELHRVMY